MMLEFSWGAQFYDHFERFLRSPAERRVFEQNVGDPSLQILTFQNVFEGCRVFASLGLSHYVDRVKRIGEVVLVADDGADELPQLLANVLFHMVQKSMTLGRGTAIAGVDLVSPAFARLSGKSAVYITLPFPFPEDFATVTGDGEEGFVFLALLLSQKEYEFARWRGSDALEAQLEAAGVDPFSLRRESAV